MIGHNTIEAIEQELLAACRRRARVETARVPRLSPGIPTLAVLIVISVAVAVPLLALHSTQTLAPHGASGSSPAPTKPTPGAVRAARAACGRLGAPLTGRLVLAAARGRYTALMFVSRKRLRVCISDGHSGDGSTEVGSDALRRFNLGADQLGLMGGGGGLAPGFPASASAGSAALRRMTAAGQERHIDGLAGKDISAVKFIFAKGAGVDATIQHGWYFAWWPSPDTPTSVRVTTTTGTVVTSRMPWADGCRPGTAGCVFAGTRAPRGHYRTGTYRDPAGWRVNVPAGWHVVRFSSTKGSVSAAGAQFSNVPLPAPSAIPGYPIQSKLGPRPASGIGLVIATDTETGLPGRSPGHIVTVPLPAPDQHGWNVGSTLVGSGQPYLETLWFKNHQTTFIASVKVGTKASRADLAAIDHIIDSLHFPGSKH